MPTVREVLRSVRVLLGRRALERELEDELRFHAEMQAREHVERGLDPGTARRRAETEMGGMLRLKEDLHDVHGATFAGAVESTLADVRLAVRRIRRSPGFAATAILTFALGLGANATMWSLADRLLFQPPPRIDRPDDLLTFQFEYVNRGDSALQRTFSYPAFQAMRGAVGAMARVTAAEVSSRELAAGRGAAASMVRAHLVMSDYFEVLGVRPARGRFFAADDDQPSVSTGSAVISDAAWRRLFGGRDDVLGRRIELANKPYTVIGVAPAGFVGMEIRRVDAWIPIAQAKGLQLAGSQWAQERNSTWLAVVARPSGGASRASLLERAAVGYRSAPETRFERQSWRFGAQPLAGWLRRDIGAVRRVTLVLTAVSLLVLLIACANLAGLFLARDIARRRETTVRIALGASRFRLGRQAFVESVVLSLIGGAGALLVAKWGGSLVARRLFAEGAWGDSMVDARLVGATLIAVLGAGLLAVLVPAHHAANPRLIEGLAGGARGGGTERATARSLLVAAQAALTVVLLVGAGLFVRSLRAVSEIDVGFSPDRVVMATVPLNQAGFSTPQSVALHDRIAERLRELPGLTNVALAITVPSYNSYGIQLMVGRDTLSRPKGGAFMNAVTPEFFAVMGMRLIRGRALSAADVDGAAPVAIVNETLARALARGGDALGRCILLDRETACRTVVGIAANSTRRNLIEDEIFHVHIPLAQAAGWRGRVVIMRTEPGREASMIGPIRMAIQGVAGGLPYANVEILESRFGAELRPWRLGATIFGAFGVLALTLAAVGLYGLLAFNVARRRTEIGVRMALGESPERILRVILARAVRLILAGCIAGLSLAAAGGRFVESLLFRTSPTDPVVYGSVLAALLLVAIVAALVPGWRATRVDPATALRAD